MILVEVGFDKTGRNSEYDGWPNPVEGPLNIGPRLTGAWKCKLRLDDVAYERKSLVIVLPSAHLVSTEQPTTAMSSELLSVGNSTKSVALVDPRSAVVLLQKARNSWSGASLSQSCGTDPVLLAEGEQPSESSTGSSIRPDSEEIYCAGVHDTRTAGILDAVVAVKLR